jgi:hypothetical protein
MTRETPVEERRVATRDAPMRRGFEMPTKDVDVLWKLGNFHGVGRPIHSGRRKPSRNVI